MENTNNGIRTEVSYGPITVDKVYTSEFQKEGTITAQLRQEIVTKSYYPSKAIASDMQDNLFNAGEFGFEEQEFENTETRIAWLDVPAGTSKEDVEAKLEASPDAVLYKVLSNKPILTSHQVYAIEEGHRTMGDFADSQAVRIPEGAENGGSLALDPNGNVQYRRVFFSATAKEDSDMRSGEDVFVSEALATEVEGVSSDQGL